jgi:hypothetical protein
LGVRLQAGHGLALDALDSSSHIVVSDDVYGHLPLFGHVRAAPRLDFTFVDLTDAENLGAKSNQVQDGLGRDR